MARKETRRLGIFSTRKFELLMSCPILTLLPPNKSRLEVSKNMQYISVAQRAAKPQLVKLEVIFHKVWQCTTLQPFKLQGRTAPFWKPPNKIFLDFRGQGYDNSFRMWEALLKWAFLLHETWNFEFHAIPTVCMSLKDGFFSKYNSRQILKSLAI